MVLRSLGGTSVFVTHRSGVVVSQGRTVLGNVIMYLRYSSQWPGLEQVCQQGSWGLTLAFNFMDNFGNALHDHADLQVSCS
jgi:hypothetical protein